MLLRRCCFACFQKKTFDSLLPSLHQLPPTLLRTGGAKPFWGWGIGKAGPRGSGTRRNTTPLPYNQLRTQEKTLSPPSVRHPVVAPSSRHPPSPTTNGNQAQKKARWAAVLPDRCHKPTAAGAPAAAAVATHRCCTSTHVKQAEARKTTGAAAAATAPATPATTASRRAPGV